MSFLLVEAVQTASRKDEAWVGCIAGWHFAKGASITKLVAGLKLGIRLRIMLRNRIDHQEFCRRGSQVAVG